MPISTRGGLAYELWNVGSDDVDVIQSLIDDDYGEIEQRFYDRDETIVTYVFDEDHELSISVKQGNETLFEKEMEVYDLNGFDFDAEDGKKVVPDGMDVEFKKY